ncbi:MAG: divergent PAP2 family protein [Patescibacteria group bacterium]
MIYPKLILIPLIVGLISFGLKIIIKAIKGTFSWELSATYGGMPSIHTAFVVSLSTVVALYDGIFSATFAMSAIFSLIIIRDAVGYRRYLGIHSKVLNSVIQELPHKERVKFPPHLQEQLGHTPLQAVIGALIGFIAAILLYIIIP